MRKDYCLRSAGKKKKLLRSQPKGQNNACSNNYQPSNIFQPINQHPFPTSALQNNQNQNKEEDSPFFQIEHQRQNLQLLSQPSNFRSSIMPQLKYELDSLQQLINQVCKNESERMQNQINTFHRVDIAKKIQAKNVGNKIKSNLSSLNGNVQNQIIGRLQSTRIDQAATKERKFTEQSRVDYHKNIPLTITKAAQRYFYKDTVIVQIVKAKCEKKLINFQQFQELLKKIKRSAKLSLTQLYYLYLNPQVPIKQIFGWYLEWFINQKYVQNLLGDSEIKNKEKYIQFKHTILSNLRHYKLRDKSTRLI